eukprot:7335012-Pyramimonas_sp.AAC.1
MSAAAGDEHPAMLTPSGVQKVAEADCEKVEFGECGAECGRSGGLEWIARPREVGVVCGFNFRMFR